MKTCHGGSYRLSKTATQDQRKLRSLAWNTRMDRAIRQFALDHDYVIATHDADFYELNLLYGQPPKIIWLKTGNQSKATIIRALLDNQAAIEQALTVENKSCIEIYR
jgi:predicted nuclease of predicted toxin-antitoxin system